MCDLRIKLEFGRGQKTFDTLTIHCKTVISRVMGTFTHAPSRYAPLRRTLYLNANHALTSKVGDNSFVNEGRVCLRSSTLQSHL